MHDNTVHPSELIEVSTQSHLLDFHGSDFKTNWLDSQLSWKESCFVGDWSFMPDLHVRGPDAGQLFSDLCVNTFEGFEPGNAKHAVMCNADGHVIGDGVLMRTDDEEYRIQNLPTWPAFNLERGDYEATAEVHDTFIYQVQGPNAIKVLRELTDADLLDIAFMNFREIDLAGDGVLALRQGMSGEVGFELQGPMEYGERVFERILQAGADFGIRHLDGRSRLVNHLESCFPTAGLHYLPAIYGADMADYREWLGGFDEGREWTPWESFNTTYSIEGSFQSEDISDWYRNPVELGWTNRIKFDHDFVGRETLEAIVDDPARTIVTLEWNSEDVADVYASLFSPGDHHKYMEMPYNPTRTMVADEVRIGDTSVGVSTGRGYSYYYRRMLSLCVIDVEYSEPGTEVTIVWGEGEAPNNPAVQSHTPKEVRATTAPAPYKPDRRRDELASYVDD